MAYDFPSNPTNGQVYLDYVYDSSSGWRSQVMVGAAPCGSIMPFAGATIPAGWLLCNGAAVSRTTYSSLFAALGGISSPWGLGDGSTTFNVPDLRKRVPVGKGDSGTLSTLGAIGGAETMTLAEAHLAAHTHSFSATTSYNGDHNHAPPVAVTYGGNAGNYRSLFATNSGFWSGGDWNNATTTNGGHTHTVSGTTGSTGSGSAFGLLQPYAVVNYIIKFSAVVAATDTEIAVRMGQAEATVTAQAAIVSGYNARLTAVENNYVPKSGANWAISNATAVTVTSTTPTVIATLNLTTNGRPVFLSASGDMNPVGGSTWNYIQLYRGSTAIGKLIINESTANSVNNPFALTFIDVPPAGVQTYTIRANKGGTYDALYGEVGNGQAPQLVAFELY